MASVLFLKKSEPLMGLFGWQKLILLDFPYVKILLCQQSKTVNQLLGHVVKQMKMEGQKEIVDDKYYKVPGYSDLVIK